jgi:predicted DNA-binding transcriptional regulator AlpA
MLKVIKKLLLQIIDDLDSGNSNIDEIDANEIIDTLKRLSDKSRLSKYSACQYLNISRASFDNYVKEGKIPRGTHSAGFKELSWSKSDLDKVIIDLKNKK